MASFLVSTPDSMSNTVSLIAFVVIVLSKNMKMPPGSYPLDCFSEVVPSSDSNLHLYLIVLYLSFA